MILSMLIYGLIIYTLCWIVHIFSDYLDFEAPSKEEKEYKRMVTKKYNIRDTEFGQLIGLSPRGDKLLHKKARAHAEHLLNNVRTIDMTQQQAETLYDYYYQNYIRHNKLYYT